MPKTGSLRLPSALHLSALMAHPPVVPWSTDFDEVTVSGADGPPRHVEPLALVMLAAWADRLRRRGGAVMLDLPSMQSPYLWNTGLLRVLGGGAVVEAGEASATSHWFPLSRMRQQHASRLHAELPKVLHLTTPGAKMVVGGAVTEIANNADEHAGPDSAAFFAAGWFETQRRVTIAIADNGIGIRKSLADVGLVAADEAEHLSIQKAMERGVTKAAGEVAYRGFRNGGLGLAQVRDWVRSCRGQLVIWSGMGLHIEQGERVVHSDVAPEAWPGTAVMVTLYPAQLGAFAPSSSTTQWGRIQQGRVDSPGLTLRPPVDAGGFASDKSWYIQHRLELQETLDAGGTVLVDFGGARFSTQSALHALLYASLATGGEAVLKRIWFDGMAGPIDEALRVVVDYSLADHGRLGREQAAKPE